MWRRSRTRQTTWTTPLRRLPNYGVPLLLPGTDAAARRGSRHTVQQLRARWATGTDSFGSMWGEVKDAVAVQIAAYGRKMGCRSEYRGRCGRMSSTSA